MKQILPSPPEVQLHDDLVRIYGAVNEINQIEKMLFFQWLLVVTNEQLNCYSLYVTYKWLDSVRKRLTWLGFING